MGFFSFFGSGNDNDDDNEEDYEWDDCRCDNTRKEVREYLYWDEDNHMYVSEKETVFVCVDCGREY